MLSLFHRGKAYLTVVEPDQIHANNMPLGLYETGLKSRLCLTAFYLIYKINNRLLNLILQKSLFVEMVFNNFMEMYYELTI
jgi:hypothetical protein